jgi:hypothetical protein
MSMLLLFAMGVRRKERRSWASPICSRTPQPFQRTCVSTARLREEWHFTEEILNMTTMPYGLSTKQEEARRIIARAFLFQAVWGLLSTAPSQEEKSALERLSEGFRSGPMIKNMNPGDKECRRGSLTSTHRIPDDITQSMCTGVQGCHGFTSANN